MDQLISQMNPFYFRKEIHFFFLHKTCFAIASTLFHPFTHVTQGSRIIGELWSLKLLLGTLLMIQRSGWKHELCLTLGKLLQMKSFELFPFTVTVRACEIMGKTFPQFLNWRDFATLITAWGKQFMCAVWESRTLWSCVVRKKSSFLEQKNAWRLHGCFCSYARKILRTLQTSK